MTSSNLEAAQQYALLGWEVLPIYEMRLGLCSCGARDCQSPGKHPRLEDGLYGASSNPITITSWWGQWPNSNIGVRCGLASGIIAIDFDIEEAVKWSMTLGDDATPRAETGGGGRHLLFLAPPYPISPRVGVLPGVDIRAENSYILVAPSNHKSGNSYRWLTKPTVDLQPVPAELEKLLRKVKPKDLPGDELTDASPEVVSRARRYLEKLPPAISGSGGHTQLFRAALVLIRGFLLSPAQAFEILRVDYSPRCEPPWGLNDLRKKVSDAFSDGTVRWGYLLAMPLPPAPVQSKGDADVEMEKVLEAEIIERHSIAAGTDNVRAMLTENKNGGTAVSLDNVSIVLLNDLQWKGVLKMDLFSGKIFFANRPPWIHWASGRTVPCELLNGDILEIAKAMTKSYGMNCSKDLVLDAIVLAANRDTFHQVRDYLYGLEWDKKPRVETWMIDYMGAEDSDYVRRVGSMWLISAIARVMTPGCEAHHCLVLESEEGTGKSMAFKILAGKWIAANMPEIGSKDAYLQLRGTWIVELAELSAVTRSETEAVKAFLSSPTDKYRGVYDKLPGDWPRQCVFGASTNKDDYLQSETGNRRFWPVKISDDPIKLKALDRDRDQIWAEALHMYQAGVNWWVDIEERGLIRAMKAMQSSRLAHDPWDEDIAAVLNDVVEQFLQAPMLSRGPHGPNITVGEILTALRVDVHARKATDAIRVARAVRKCGWKIQRGRRSGEHVLKMYIAPDDLWLHKEAGPCHHANVMFEDGQRKCTRCRVVMEKS